MAATPAFASTPLLDIAQIGVANTGRDGTGTIVAVATGTATGKRLSRVTVKALQTTTAGTVRFFLSADSGVTKRLLTEVAVSAVTASSSVPAFETTVDALIGLVLPGATVQLMAATEKGETFNIVAESAGL